MTTARHPHLSDTPSWVRLWLGCLVAVLLGPAVVLAWHQWHSRHVERLDWAATLDPMTPDPGTTPAEDVPTEGARRVTIGFYLETMGDLSMPESRFDATIDVWCRWRDDDPNAVAGEAFNPFEHLIAVGGRIEDRKLLQRIDDGPEHFELQRLKVSFTKVFGTTSFPLDRHLLLMAFENSAHPRQTLLFVPDFEASSISTRARLSGYRIEQFHVVEMPHSYRTSRGLPGVPPETRATYSQPRFALVIDRGGWGLFTKLFQAMFVAVGVALLACFIRPIHVDPRFGLGVGGLFAAVANGYLVTANMPEGGDFSLADEITLLGIVTILVSIAGSAMSLFVYDSLGRHGLSQRLDRLTFWTILGCFAAALVMLVAAAAVG
jgi:hypothetical protein